MYTLVPQLPRLVEQRGCGAWAETREGGSRKGAAPRANR